MQQQFALKLCDYRLYVWLGIAGMLAAFLVAALLASQATAGALQLAILATVGGAGFCGVYWLLRKATIRVAHLTVDVAGLTVHYPSCGKTTHIAFDEVVSYRDEWLRDGRELRFRLRSGEKVRLATNDFLAPAEGYAPLLQAVQRAIAQRNAADPAITREKSFFEKPFATILLVVTGVLLLLAAGEMLIGRKPFQGSFLTAAATWGAYFFMWRAARANRR
ncbi:MAG TPA: hypothetical protein VFO93_11645 [Hymenobacter sp.]|uniref:hypothetical protein n=1 Tax=Hymenobacter sp. TaxID=1898978 RepID=UPI002D7FE907|nr:hypothetical protein [Hymenobacter sp.]HET9504187.1 hypothetical protein [Hymenobacter sp.]